MALQLQERGLKVRPLAGGYAAWRDRYPVEPKRGDETRMPVPPP